MNLEEHHLILLMEEGAEAQMELSLMRMIQRASKQLRFGQHEIEPGQLLTNRERLRYEILDVMACARFLSRSGQIDSIFQGDIERHIESKKAKIAATLAKAKEAGRLKDG